MVQVTQKEKISELIPILTLLFVFQVQLLPSYARILTRNFENKSEKGFIQL